MSVREFANPDADVRRRAKRSNGGATRRPLRVVKTHSRRSEDRISLRVRAIALTIGGLAVLFSLVTFHVVLSQGQFRLEKMARASVAQQDQYQRLRLQVAELESPDTVMTIARDRLGMVTPEIVTPITPSPADLPKGVDLEPIPVTNNPDQFDDPSLGDWSRIKPLVTSSAS